MSNPVIPDRLAAILAPGNTTITGIDFINVEPTQELQLTVNFLKPPSLLNPPLNTTLTAIADVLIYCPALGGATIPVTNLAWAGDQLQLTVQQPGGFALYNLKLTSPSIDPYYNDIVFSFKAGCPSRLDCLTQPEPCPPDVGNDFPIDYLARDFHSLKRALLEFASLRYPAWQDRLEADAGIMLAELMSAAGDEMAYHQDRIAREGYLETATQRRSLRRLARLVDYDIQDGLGSHGPIVIHMHNVPDYILEAGYNVWALGNGGQRVDFEIGKGLAETHEFGPKTFTISYARNTLKPHIWDKAAVCLPVGATQLYLEGDQTANLPFDDIPADGSAPGKWVEIRTNPQDPELLQTAPWRIVQQPRTQLVRIVQLSVVADPVLGDKTTLIQWEQAQALPFEFDQSAALRVHANLLPATAGKTHRAFFIVGQEFSALPSVQQQALLSFAGLGPTDTIDRAIERQGRDGTIAYRYTLPGTDAQNLVWLRSTEINSEYAATDPDIAPPAPEVVMEALYFDAATTQWRADKHDPWTWRLSFMGDEYTSGPEDRDFSFDDGNWTRVVGYIDAEQTYVHKDYAAGMGLSLLFGDGAFGLAPLPGAVFEVKYRLGGGSLSNVAARVVTHFNPLTSGGQPVIRTVTNPVAAIDGMDPQTPDEIRQLAPQAYQAVTYRAVRPQDYAAAAELLPWVQEAGCQFRWTGSWISAFVTADPSGQIGLSATEVQDLDYQEERYRQAGREVIITQPIYANLDMEIEVCARPDAYAGQVQERVMTALFGSKGYPPIEGYFSPDRFTFGTLLERSTLEAAIQEVPGVLAVEWIRFRRRGFFDWKKFMDYSYDPGKDSIICIANDPLHPEEGILTLNVHGGL
jgi:hypothetical protein